MTKTEQSGQLSQYTSAEQLTDGSGATCTSKCTSKNEQHIELLVPRALGMDHTFTLTFAPEGRTLDENLKATVIVRNDGIIDTSNAAFNMDDYTKLRTITVNYVDKNGNKVAEPKHVKAYGIHELYALG